MSARVLVVGAGGREHAIAWKLAQSPYVAQVIVAPGNPGMLLSWKHSLAKKLVLWGDARIDGLADYKALAARAKAECIELTVIGPDHPLAGGIVDEFREQGLRVFGPTSAAAKIEWSKAFAKDIMEAAQIPTARYKAFRDLESALKFLRASEWKGWAVKADGLAYGKGVKVCVTMAEAVYAAKELFQLSGQLVIEERLTGKEISWMALTDGKHCSLLNPAQDYKRAEDHDLGPNTGGMGAYSPVPGIDEALTETVRTQVFIPAIQEMRKRGIPFQGVLYAGLMVEEGKFWVLEFNARFGDPETQVLMPRINDDLYVWLKAVADGDISSLPRRVPFVKDCAVVVVGAAKGYPDKPEKGQLISGSVIANPDDDHAGLFFAGVGSPVGVPVTSGGRVFGAIGMGSDFEKARIQAYDRLAEVSFAGMWYRRDIAEKPGI